MVFFPIDFMNQNFQPHLVKTPEEASICETRFKNPNLQVVGVLFGFVLIFSKTPEIFEEISHFEHFFSFQQKTPTKTQQVNVHVDVGILVDDAERRSWREIPHLLTRVLRRTSVPFASSICSINRLLLIGWERASYGGFDQHILVIV